MNPQRDYIQGLMEAIRKTHGVPEARHIGKVPVQEMFRGEVAWQGDVEVFQVQHPSGATRCYGWGYPSDDDPSRYEYVCVLGAGWVDSPRKAIAAAIRAQTREGGPTNKGDK